MNDFEFLRDLPIGQYIPGVSIIYRLDPRTRILGVIGFLILITFEPRTLGLASALLIVLAGWWLARISVSPAIKGWRATLPFLLILVVLQVFFHAGQQVGVQIFQVFGKGITTGDLLVGANLLLRFSAYIAALGLASSTLSSSDITHGLDQLLLPLNKMHLPAHDLVMMVQVTLRFFPLLAQTAERIAKAQASRGANWETKGNLIRRVRQIIPLLVPLFVTSLRRAENLALAMDSRAYGVNLMSTSMVELNFGRRDWFALAIVACFILLVVWL